MLVDEMDDPYSRAENSKEVGISFDDTYRVRIFNHEKAEDTKNLERECREFVSKIVQFNDIAKNLSEVIEGQAARIEHEKLKAIGLRNRVESEKEARKRKEQEIETIINEKRAELQRYQLQLKSLSNVEQEQRVLIERLGNNEA